MEFDKSDTLSVSAAISDVHSFFPLTHKWSPSHVEIIFKFIHFNCLLLSELEIELKLAAGRSTTRTDLYFLLKNVDFKVN